MATMRTGMVTVVGAVALAGIVSVFIGGSIRIGDATITFGGPTPRSILLEMGLPPEARDVGAFEIVHEDGNRPGSAGRSFEIDPDVRDVREFYRKRCEALGLSLTEPQAISPNLFCKGRRAGSVGFYLSVRCERSCRAFTAIQKIGG